ncbi:VWA domain-containing protein [Myxococcota bacterium]
MSFLSVAALAVAVLVAAPLLAHWLHGGSRAAVEFPPARLVPPVESMARRSGKLEDRLLLSLRALWILALALLGATPLVRCASVRVSRSHGGSVAVALVLDDSLSMRTITRQGESRWKRAMAAAHSLLASTREGDAFAVLLAGRPARLALGPTTDLRLVRRTLRSLSPGDRSTDLQGAASLARSCLEGLPQPDRRLVWLSDLAGEVPTGDKLTMWAPLAELRESSADCGVITAERLVGAVKAEVVCSDAAASQVRQLELVVAEKGSAVRVLASAPLASSMGSQTVSISARDVPDPVDVRLTGTDDNPSNDRAPVVAVDAGWQVAVVADPARSSVVTGGPTLTEQALRALGPPITVRPLARVPEEHGELEPYSMLVLDDPAGLTPEARSTLARWLRDGHVALALLGRAAESTELGLSMEPFAQGPLRWESTSCQGLDVSGLEWMGPDAVTLSQLDPRGRVLLDRAKPPGARVVGRWDDGAAWLLRREQGRGVVFTAGLPTAVDVGDLGLRPGFLALLDHLLTETSRRLGPRNSLVGETWSFAPELQVKLRGPEGLGPCCDVGQDGYQTLNLSLAGRYEVTVNGQKQTRIVRPEATEILDSPAELREGQPGWLIGKVTEPIDMSSELVWLILVLGGLEIGARLLLGGKRVAISEAA